MEAKPRLYKPGELIDIDGRMSPFVVQSGIVASFILTSEGGRVIDALYPKDTGYVPVKPEEMEGHTPSSTESAYKSYISLGETVVSYLYPPTRMQVNAALTYGSYFFALISTLDAWRGVLFCMLELGQRETVAGREVIKFRLLQHLIGDVVRYTRESVSNAVSHLKRLGLVTTYKEGSQPVILLHDIRRAEALVKGLKP